MLVLDAMYRPQGSVVKNAGYDAVMGYVSTPGNPKNVDASEWRDNVAAGVAMAFIFETTAQRALDGRVAGQNDAVTSVQQLNAVGLSYKNQPVYFAVDFDATPQQQSVIDDYLRGCADVLDINFVGVYGGYWVVKRCLDLGTARWAWQTMAWSGGNIDPRIHLLQRLQTVVVGGRTCDVNETRQDNFGQYPPIGMDLTMVTLDDLKNAVREVLQGAHPSGEIEPGRNPVDVWKQTEWNTNTTLEQLRIMNDTLNRIATKLGA